MLEKFEYSDWAYFKNKRSGYELWFSKEPDFRLSHVTLYNQDVEGFNRYKGNLPFGVDWEKWNNTMIIRRFGDTPVKGGGSINVFLTYNNLKNSDLGIGFTFMNKSWHDRENPLIHISLFSPINNKKKPKCSLWLKEAKDLKWDNWPFIRFWGEKCLINFSKVHICNF